MCTAACRVSVTVFSVQLWNRHTRPVLLSLLYIYSRKAAEQTLQEVVWQKIGLIRTWWVEFWRLFCSVRKIDCSFYSRAACKQHNTQLANVTQFCHLRQANDPLCHTGIKLSTKVWPMRTIVTHLADKWPVENWLLPCFQILKNK